VKGLSVVGRYMLLKPEVSVRKISPLVDLISGITMPKAFPWLPKTYVSSSEALEPMEAAAPLDGVEIVEWMRRCAAINAALYGMMEDYNRLRPRMSPQALIVNSNDAYIPGVAISSDFCFQSIPASRALADGNVVLITPTGTVTMPVNSSQTIIGPSFLGWAANLNFQTLQWTGVLAQWQELASKPVTEGVRCANIEGFVSPMFYDCPGGLVRNVTTVTVTSDKPQTVTLTGLAPYDYTVKMFEFTQPIEAGQTEITYRVFGLPRATHHVLQITPENNTQTIIDSVT
jgi:hypothetical protein